MLRDGLMQVSNEMPEYFQEDGEELQKTASALYEEITQNNYTDRDLLKIAYLDILTANDMLKTYRDNFEDAQEEMEKNASVAKRRYEETGYLAKVAEYLASNLSSDELNDVANTIAAMEKDASYYMESQGFAGEKGRFRAHMELFGTPGDLIKEASYNMYVISQNIDY